MVTIKEANEKLKVITKGELSSKTQVHFATRKHSFSKRLANFISGDNEEPEVYSAQIDVSIPEEYDNFLIMAENGKPKSLSEYIFNLLEKKGFNYESYCFGYDLEKIIKSSNPRFFDEIKENVEYAYNILRAADSVVEKESAENYLKFASKM